MDNFMNPPIELEWGVPDVVRAYDECKDLKRAAKIYCITVKEVREMLKTAKVKILSKNDREKQYTEIEKELHAVGMSQKDFYEDKK